MGNKKIIVVIVLLIILIGGASLLYAKLGKDYAPDQISTDESKSETDKEQEEETGESNQQEDEELMLAPDFTVYDIQGKEVHLSSYIGKPIVLNFWASWCGPCQSEMPDFNEKYLELGDEVQFLMVNMTDGTSETLETASQFIEEKGYVFPVVYDTDSDAMMTYGAFSLPTTFFIDAEGYVVAQAVGAIDGETLQKGIDMIR